MHKNKYKNFLTQIIKIERDTYFRDHRLFLKDNIFLIINFFSSRIDFYYFYIIQLRISIKIKSLWIKSPIWNKLKYTFLVKHKFRIYYVNLNYFCFNNKLNMGTKCKSSEFKMWSKINFGKFTLSFFLY